MSSFSRVLGALAGPRSRRSVQQHVIFIRICAFWRLKTRKIFWPRRGVRLKAGAAKFSLWYILLLAPFRITSPHRQRRAHLWRRVHALRSHQHRGGVGGGGALLSGWWRWRWRRRRRRRGCFSGGRGCIRRVAASGRRAARREDAAINRHLVALECALAVLNARDRQMVCAIIAQRRRRRCGCAHAPAEPKQRKHARQ